ncbi:MAG: hypothetical protein Q8P18_04670 [Pseudomonadota bacterium]|nr:hypothetical protein [Pseudomonadota bacterium]
MSPLLLLLACPGAPRVASASVAAAPSSSESRLLLPGLSDVACDGADCRALVRGTLVSLPGAAPIGTVGALEAFDTLRFTPSGWEVEGRCVPLAPGPRCVAPLAADGAVGVLAPAAAPPALEQDAPSLGAAAIEFGAAWNAGIAAGWRSGFHRVIVGPGSGRITWLRGIDGAGQLVRVGNGSRTARLGSATASVSWPGWLALHPTGVEAYLVAWPSPLVRAFDPTTLDIRWTLPVEGAARGLFVDPGGRWLLVAVGPGTTERLVEWPLPSLEATPTGDLSRDEVLRALEHPPMDGVLVIDLSTQSVVARAEGELRRFLPLPDRPLLATDREIVFFTPGALP